MSLTGRSAFFTFIALLLLFVAGCGTTRLFTKPIAEASYVTYPDWGPNRNVAVMPLVNVSKDKDAGLKVRELLLAELYISGAFKDVVDEGEMLEVMKKLKIRETDPIGKDTIKTLGDNLGVQAVIFGTVTDYTERTTKGAQFVVSMRMIDVETGSILWLGNSSKEGGGSVGEALGLSDGPTVVVVARAVIQDLVGDLAHEINRMRTSKPKTKKPDDSAKKDDGQNANVQNTSASKKKDAAPTAGNQQAVAAPPPAVKGGSAGMFSTPALIVK